MNMEDPLNVEEIETLYCTMQTVLNEVKTKAVRGDANDVLKVIDEYCWKSAQLIMNVGDVKGEILDRLFTECDPTTAVELGSFMGYSAVRMSRLLKKEGAKLYSIEINPKCVKVAREMVEYAGLSDKVTIIQGPSTEVIATLEEKYGIKKVDFLFIDHWKTLYQTDLVKFVDVGLVKKGTVVVADNILYPGAPEYAEYVRKNPRFESTFLRSELEYKPHVPDGMEKSVYLG